jgi:predicted Rossmann fold nucleotide-binding protein DprA/Smf involved in DNA uptake
LCSGPSDFFQTDAKRELESIGENPHSGILDFIGSVPVSESVLTSLAKKNVSEILSELVRLELSGLVRKVDGGYVRV